MLPIGTAFGLLKTSVRTNVLHRQPPQHSAAFTTPRLGASRCVCCCGVCSPVLLRRRRQRRLPRSPTSETRRGRHRRCRTGPAVTRAPTAGQGCRARAHQSLSRTLDCESSDSKDSYRRDSDPSAALVFFVPASYSCTNYVIVLPALPCDAQQGPDCAVQGSDHVVHSGELL